MTTRRAKIVNVDCWFGAPAGYAAELAATEPLGADWSFTKAETEEEIIAAGRDADVLLLELTTTRITRSVIQNLEKCRLIAKYAVGYDNIDVQAATDHGIVVCNAAEFCIEEVSDHAVALLLACARRIVTLDRQVRSQGWVEGNLDTPFRRVGRLTLGLIAFGRIARLVARKMKAFGVRMLATDPYVPRELEAEYGVTLVPLERLLRESDLISIHALLNAETRNMIGERELRSMKPSAFLVNTGRGALIDEKALVGALEEKRIAGAALDVMAEEPLPLDSPLRKFDNVVLTPHFAGLSSDAITDLHRIMSDSVAAVLQGCWPPFPVDPGVVPRVPLKPYSNLRPAGGAARDI